MFTRDADIIDIFLYYRKNKYNYIVLSRKKFLELDELEKSKYFELNIKMKSLTWGLYNTLQEINNDNGFKEFKEKKLKSLLVGWCTKDKNGILTKVPVSDEEIMRLHPKIAESILSEYDSEVFINEDEEKKIAGNVYSYIMGKGKSTSAVTRAIIENDLIEEYHWLPQDIAKIPYRKLQEFFLIRREKQNARNARTAVSDFKQKINSSSSSQRGQQRRVRK